MLKWREIYAKIAHDRREIVHIFIIYMRMWWTKTPLDREKQPSS